MIVVGVGMVTSFVVGDDWRGGRPHASANKGWNGRAWTRAVARRGAHHCPRPVRGPQTNQAVTMARGSESTAENAPVLPARQPTRIAKTHT